MSVTTVMSQQVPEIVEQNVVDVKDNATGKAGNSLMQLVSLMLVNESCVGKPGATKPNAPSSRERVKRVWEHEHEASDEEGRMSAEESTVAGSIAASPTLSLTAPSGSPALSYTAPSLDADTEELSDLEQNEHLEQEGFEVLTTPLASPGGFHAVGRRLASVFADLNETSSEGGFDDPSDDDKVVDVMQWQAVGKRLCSLRWLDMEGSDLED